MADLAPQPDVMDRYSTPSANALGLQAFKDAQPATPPVASPAAAPTGPINGNTITQAAAAPEPTMTDISSEGANLNVAKVPPINLRGALSTAVTALGGTSVNPNTAAPRPGPVSVAAGGAGQQINEPLPAGSYGMGNRSEDFTGATPGVGVAPGAGATTPMVGNAQPSDGIARANTIAKAQSDAIDAKNATEVQQNRQFNSANNAGLIANYAAEQANDRLRVARNGAGGINTYRGAITSAQNDADSKNAAANAARGAVTAAAGGRNFIQEAAAGQKLTQGAQKASTEEQAAQGGLTLQQQQVRQGEVQAHIQQHMSQLQQMALGTGPDAQAAQESLAMYQKAQKGIGGPVTPEDLLKTYGDMQARAIAMSGPDAYKTLPSFQEFSNAIKGGGQIAAPAPVEGKTYTDAKGNRAKFVGGQYVPQ